MWGRKGLLAAAQPAARVAVPAPRRMGTSGAGPLAGLRVLELGSFIAGPYAAAILGSFGADVIKVEPAGGDQLRKWRELDPAGTSFWFRSLARNKRSVAIDLRSEGGRRVVRALAAKCDCLVENFRPGRMEEWGLGPAALAADNPGLVYTRVSGYGQTGPYRERPGFASACEAMGGLRYVNGFPGQASVRPNLSLGDTLAGQQAALGAVLALLARERGGTGQVVDASIVEAVFGVLEGVLPEYSGAGAVRGPSGSSVSGIVPTGTYECGDGVSVVIGANSDSLFARLADVMGTPRFADPEYIGNERRVARQEEIDGAIGQWTASLPSCEVLAALDDAEIPNGKIYSIADIAEDPHVQERGMFETITVAEEGMESYELSVPATVPRLSVTPGGGRLPAPCEPGEHTREVLGEVLGYSNGCIDDLVAAGDVAVAQRS